MKVALFLFGDNYCNSYHSAVTEDMTLPQPYILRDEVPEVLLNLAEGKIAKYLPDTDEFIEVDNPFIKPDPIADIQLAIAELAEANEQSKTDMQLAIAELAELVVGGGA